MPTRFEQTENTVSHSLKEHSDSTQGFSKELHGLQNSESADAFKKDMTRLNDDLHKNGLLPGLQIVENAQTHQFEIKPIEAAANNPAQSAPADAPQSQPADQPHGGSRSAAHSSEHHEHGHHGHHGRHHHKHHGKHGEAGNGRDDDDSDDNQQDSQDQKNPKDQTDSKNSKDSPDGKDKSSAPDKGDSKDASGLSSQQKEQYIFNRLTDNHEGGLHLTKAQAAGVVGSLKGESSNLYSGYTDHPKEHDLGIANWLGTRKHDLEKFSGGDATNFYKQVDFIEHELNGSESKALRLLRTAQTPRQAATDFTVAYERPGIPHLQNRRELAQLAFTRMGNQMGDPLENPNEYRA